jgi:hypothetical protein
MQQDRSSGYACSRISVGPALSAGPNANGLHHENHEQTVRKDAIERREEPQERVPDISPLDAQSIPRLGLVSCAASAPRQRVRPSEFRTQVLVGQVMVTGVLPGAAWTEGSVAISGDVRRLSCDEALELVDALLLVVTRMDVVAEKRYGTPIDPPCDREDGATRSQPQARRPTAVDGA